MKFRDFHKNIRMRIYVFFAFGTVQATTFPFMAIYFARAFGESLAGILLAVSVIASLISGAFGGYYADKVGRKKLMVMAEAIFLVSYLTMAVANSPWVHSPTLTFVSFLVINACWGIYGPADEAMLLDVTTTDNRQFMYAIFYWVNNLTMAVGASVGAVLFDAYRFELFGLMTIVVLVSLLVTIFFIEETYRPPLVHVSRQSRFSLGIVHNYIAVFRNGIFVRYALAGLLAAFGEFQLSNYIGIHLSKHLTAKSIELLPGHLLHLDGIKMIGFLQTENTILVVLLATIAGRLIRKFPDKWILIVAILLNTVGYSTMTVVSTPIILFIAMFVATVGEVTGVPIRQAYLGDIAPENARSSYVAVNGMTYSGSRVLASLGVVLGVYVPDWGIGAISMTIGVISLLLYLSIVPAVHRQRAQVGLGTQSSQA